MGSLYDGLASAQAASQKQYLDAQQKSYDDQISGLQTANGSLQQQVDDLTRQLADCQSGGGKVGTAFGSSINGPAFKPKSGGGLGYPGAPVTRVYLRSLPAGSTWTSIKGDDNATKDLADGVRLSTGILWISVKENDPALLDAFLATMPKNLNLEVWGTWHHEPEDEAPPSGNLKPADFVAKFKAMAPVFRKYGVKSTIILMRYTFGSGSGRDWHDWWPGADYVDIFGFDSYNTGNKKQKYSDPNEQYKPLIDAAKEVGKPWAIGETGASVWNNNYAARVDWINGCKQVMRDGGCVGAAWWDSDSYILDSTAAAAWFA